MKQDQESASEASPVSNQQESPGLRILASRLYSWATDHELEWLLSMMRTSMSDRSKTVPFNRAPGVDEASFEKN